MSATYMWTCAGYYYNERNIRTNIVPTFNADDIANSKSKSRLV